MNTEDSQPREAKDWAIALGLFIVGILPFIVSVPFSEDPFSGTDWLLSLVPAVVMVILFLGSRTLEGWRRGDDSRD